MGYSCLKVYLLFSIVFIGVNNSIAQQEWVTSGAKSGPIPDFECVSVFSLPNRSENGAVQLTAYAAPNACPKANLERMQLNDVSYSIGPVDADGKLVLSIHARFMPVVQPPKWLIKNWLPDGPIRIMDNFIKTAKKL